MCTKELESAVSRFVFGGVGSCRGWLQDSRRTRHRCKRTIECFADCTKMRIRDLKAAGRKILLQKEAK